VAQATRGAAFLGDIAVLVVLSGRLHGFALCEEAGELTLVEYGRGAFGLPRYLFVTPAWTKIASGVAWAKVFETKPWDRTWGDE
jgi:hypothetical protein